MKEKRKLSLFVKLMSGFISIALLLLMFSLYSVSQLGIVGGYFDKAYNEAVVPMERWAQFKLRLGDIRSLLNCHIVEQDLEKHGKIESELTEKFRLANQLLIKLGADAVSKDEIAIIEQEEKKGINHSVTDYSKESQVRIMASVKFHWDQISNISNQITEYSRNFMKEDASAILNTGRGQERFATVENATSAILERADHYVADYHRKSLQLRRQVQLYLIMGSAFAVLLSLLLSYFLARGITMPVRIVAAGLKDIAEGEGNLTKRLDVLTKDELGELAAWFNIFIEKLQEIMKEIADTTHSLSKSSEKMSAVSAQMALSADEMNSQANMVATESEQVNANVGAVASATEQASSSLSNIASMTEEMSSALNNVAGFGHKTADNVKEMADSSENMLTQANSVASAIEEMTASLNEVAKNTVQASQVSQDASQRTEQINTRMEALVASSRQIGKIVSVIKDIADQTNMLALNATIEAAGAGEAGKGFAVVAGEVKELAKQSADATDEIAGQIEEIQKSINDTVRGIEDINKIMNEVADINQMIAASAEEQTATAGEISKSVANTALTVKNLADNANESANLVGEIAKSTDETSKTASEIARNIDELLIKVKDVAHSSDKASRGVNDISKNIHMISSASDQTATGASQTSESSEELAEMALALTQIVSRFKLKKG